MFTTLKSIVRKLSFHEAPIYYYDFDSNEQYPLHFRCISKERQSEYDSLSKKEKKSYISDSAQINIPNMSISKFALLYKEKDIFTWNYTMDKIRKLGFTEASNEEAEEMFALYSILHEIGHWTHFRSVGARIGEYVKGNTQAEYVYNLQNQLREKVDRQGGQLGEDDIAELKRLVEKYNAVPNERIANDFADAEFGRAWAKLSSL